MSFEFSSPVRHAGIPLPVIEDSPIKKMNTIEDMFGSPNSPRRKHFLPTIRSTDSVLHITGDTLCNLLDGMYDSYFNELYLIDARFSYEFDGGHIRGATNINSPLLLKELFFDIQRPNSLIVFHCEFSQSRGPMTAQKFREIDRIYNTYPNLSYPYIYILDGGYKRFFREHPNYCEGGYVNMYDNFHCQNGDFVREEAMFRENMESFNSWKTRSRPQMSFRELRSPVEPRYTEMQQSPLASRTFRFNTSP